MLVLFDVSGVAFLLALVLTPWVRNFATKAGWTDNPDHARKLHLKSVPRVGGIAVAGAYLISLGLLLVAPYRNLSIDLDAGLARTLGLAPAVGIVFCVGLIDDIWGLRPWQKLLGEAFAASAAYVAGFGIHALAGQVLTDWLAFPLTVVWLVGCANALNLIDGMDGLASGVGLFATLTSLVAALVHNSLELALVTAPLVGALLGFLRYNFNPASIFLGDCGSLTIGFLLGCFGSLWSQKSATVLGMTAPLLALAMPLLDTALAIARRFLRRQPIFGADRGHIHHRLLDQGMTPRRAALLLYGACGLAAALSLLQDLSNDRFGGLIIVAFCGAAWIGVQHLGYAEIGVAGHLMLRGAFRGMVNAQLRMQQFERGLYQTADFDEAWQTILAGVQDFGLFGVRMRIGTRSLDSIPDCRDAMLWQVRVPLPGEQFLNLYYEPTKDIHPVILATLPKTLEGFLLSRFFSGDVKGDPPSRELTGSPR